MQTDQKVKDQSENQIIYQTIKTQSIKRYSNHFKSKFKKQYHHTNIYTVICSIGFINNQTKQIKIIAITNGTKSIPYSLYIQHKTSLLKDLHAEILAIKAFRRFIIDQLSKQHSQYFILDQKCNKKEFNEKQYQIFLYSSEPFCGDCSVNQQQGFFSGGKPLQYFCSQYLPNQKFEKHILRTKPGRLDLPLHKRSLSLSCSDKLALYNLVGIQGKQLFHKVKPIYINTFVIDAKQTQKQCIKQGLNFILRLSQLRKQPQSLLQRKIFNIIVDSKQRKISNQFKPNKPQVICLQKQKNTVQQLDENQNNFQNNKKKQKQGLQISLIQLNGQFEWTNSKTGLPEGSSLNNYTKKGKISQFSKKKLTQKISSLYLTTQTHIDNVQNFKYSAIKQRIKTLFGMWTDNFKTLSVTKKTFQS